MPSFAFWKSSKTEEVAQEPLLAVDAVPNESKGSTIVPKNLDLDPGNEDSGVFLFDESDLPAQETPLLQQEEVTMGADAISLRDASNFCTSNKDVDRVYPSPGTSPEQSCLSPAVPQSISSETHFKKPRVIVKVTRKAPSPEEQKPDLNTHHDSPAYSSRPTSLNAIDTTLSRVSSITSKHATPTRSLAPQRTESLARLRRPAELNLSTSPTTSDASRPRSELEQRHALIRNSKTQSKAALRSPTALLEERLNQCTSNRDLQQRPSPKTRVFTPPPPTPENGCWIPGPGAQANPFTSSSIRACTEATKRPAWWCKFDKLVVFDGMCDDGKGTLEICTRTSKGLTIARRRGELESIVMPLGCAHCQDMLKRHEWKYDMRVCKRNVCWECRERCLWEWEEELRGRAADKADGSRERADSVLQEG
ncbi:hypothetical protein yc1106_02359 [Curvularia clavata]|uniref:Uncharacterized protein n=1 Tax=Curvularia clavata TaxID=95742 RepID=A0A9Q9DQG8_CURCL|nr:hypothetical protein yc1106_02359 [Curvularia clavata]